MRRGLAGLTLTLLTLSLASVPGASAANFPGEQPTYAREAGNVSHFFYKSGGDGDGQVEYICNCYPGTSGCGTESSSVWQVIKFTYDSSSRISTKTYAAGDDAYSNSCANRVSLDYVD